MSRWITHLAFLGAAAALLFVPAMEPVDTKSGGYGYVFWCDFDRGAHQSYPWWKLKQDFPGVQNWDYGVGGRYGGDNDSRVYLSGTSKSGTNALKISYPKDKWNVVDSGASFEYPLGSSHDKLFLEYWVRFDGNFDWFPRDGKDYAGGKLPGLAGGPEGHEVSGGKKANGYNGFTSRLMWREYGKLAVYAYRENTSEKYGDYFYAKYPAGHSKAGQNYYLPRNKWVKVKMEVKMNSRRSDGYWRTDGHAKLWVNEGNGDIFVVNKGGIRWRKTYDIKIDTFYFSTFFGGNNIHWAPNNDTSKVWIDDIHCFTWN